MKKALLPILCLFINFSLFSQANVWMVPIVANNVYLRNPASTVFDSITIDCPTNGKVFLRFDGNCNSSPGDRMIFASSDYPDWRTNDGNTAVIVSDSTHTLTCFDHTRVYPVEAGTHTYYAVGQNYVDTHGSGYASISGHFSVLFMPDSLPDQSLSGIGINDCCWSWGDGTHVFPHDSIEVKSNGKLLVNFESFVAEGDQTRLEFGTSLEPLWNTVTNTTPVTAQDDEGFSSFMHQDAINVEPGTYPVYGLVNIIAGDSSSTNNYLYGTLSAQFIPDDNPTNLLRHTKFEDAFSDLKVHIMDQLTFTNTLAGKAWLHVTGISNTAFDDSVQVRIVDASLTDTMISEIKLKPYVEGSDVINFSLSGLKEVLPGTHTFYVQSVYDNAVTGIGRADVAGMFSIQFIGDPIPSKVVDPEFNELLSVYPNPTSGQFYIQSRGVDMDQPAEVMILNIAGQCIQQQTMSSINEFNGDLSQMPDGEYLVYIQLGNRVGVKQIVKANAQK